MLLKDRDNVVEQSWLSVNVFRHTLNCLNLLTLDSSACIFKTNKRNKAL